LNSNKPIIGISCNVLPDTSGRFENFWRAYVNEDYVTSVLKAGGIPIMLPIIDNKEAIRAQLDCVDGIIVTGGDADVNPALYGEELVKESSAPNDKRDEFDLELAKIVDELKKPTLNICRGHQIGNVFREGSIFQDVSYANKKHLKHDGHPTPDFLAHEVKISKESLLYDIIGKEDISVNSFHHQSIKKVAPTLMASAVASDGIIECLEYKNPEYFFLSLQWHPEMMAARGNKDMLKIFQRLVQEAKIKKES